MLLGLLNDLLFVVSVVTIRCVASPEENLTLPALIQHNPGSSLPVIVTAAESTSTAEVQHAGKQSETTRVVTTTNVVFKTTTVLTTISSQVTKSPVSPSNALEVLSAALQSFSSIETGSSLPLLTTGQSQTATQVTNAQHHSPAHGVATSNLDRASYHSHQPAGSNTDRTTTITTSQAKTATLDGAPITSNGPSGNTWTAQPSMNSRSVSSTLADPVSVPITSTISKSTALTTSKPNSLTAASSSTDVTAVFGNGIPQGTFTASQSGAPPSLLKATRLKMAAAALALLTFLLQ